MKIEIFDTTLRDGNQAYNVSFTSQDKLYLIEQFDQFGIDYIEIGWPRTGSADLELIKQIPKKGALKK